MQRLFAETAGWIVLVVGMWLYSGSYDRPMFGTDISIVLWPRLLLVLIVIAALMHGLERYNQLRAAQRSQHDTDVSPPIDGEQGQSARLGISILVCAAYVFLLPKLGFFVTTPFLVTGFMIVFREYRWQHLLITSFVLVAAISVLFTRFLFVPLPTGNVEGFYEFNTAIVETIRG